MPESAVKSSEAGMLTINALFPNLDFLSESTTAQSFELRSYVRTLVDSASRYKAGATVFRLFVDSN